MLKHLKNNLSKKFTSNLTAKKNLFFVNTSKKNHENHQQTIKKYRACTFEDILVKIMLHPVHMGQGIQEYTV